MRYVIVVDVGSTTTKALLFGLGEEWRLLQRGEAATTVEAPYEDVMVGVQRSIQMLQERCGMKLIDDSAPTFSLISDGFLATSSAGGGLQMVACGNVARISVESAERAAMGGGAILLDVFSLDDGRDQFQRLERLRTLRPDMILISGGVEGAKITSFVTEMCDFIRTSKPRPKFGYTHALPVIYAGTSSASDIVDDLLGDGFVVRKVPNLRPDFDRENLEPTRQMIHELFIEHVMSNAPGYGQLQTKVSLPLMPTPTAVGEILSLYASERKVNVLCVDIGGATTDVFSVVEGMYVRSVSANYGMSYSIGQVASVAGEANVHRWIPVPMSSEDMLNRLANKLLFPVTIPAEKEDLWVEQAAAREALRLSFEDHVAIAKVQEKRSLFASTLSRNERELGIEEFDLIIGSGGVLSNAPDRGQAAAMMLDAFQPLGITELMVDSVFMLPHLGSFAQMDKSGAMNILEKDCLLPLGTSIVPHGQLEKGRQGVTVRGTSSTGKQIDLSAVGGELSVFPLAPGETAKVDISVHNGLRWQGETSVTLRGGVVGIIVDLRGRPLLLDSASEASAAYAPEWLNTLKASHVKEGAL